MTKPGLLLAAVCLGGLAPAPAALAALAAKPGGAAASRLEIVEGTLPSGEPTALWLEILERRGGAPSPENRELRPFAPLELAWIERIRAALPALEAELPRLSSPFAPVTLPPSIRIVVGNRGSSDAFTHDGRTIGFDLSTLVREYGDAGAPENAVRLLRFLRHETTHLLQKARPELVPEAGTPLDRALAECWSEGHGNLHSLSERWVGANGELTATANLALARLEPRFVARLAALACAKPGSEAALTGDLSSGRFDEKWGALPVALWLARESAASPQALRDFVHGGPGGIWDLAARNLPSALAAALAETRLAAASCAGAPATR